MVEVTQVGDVAAWMLLGLSIVQHLWMWLMPGARLLWLLHVILLEWRPPLSIVKQVHFLRCPGPPNQCHSWGGAE
jgi:hypothetical protein